MGHRGASEGESQGHFSMAEHADEWMESMEDRSEMREAVRVKSEEQKKLEGKELRNEAKVRYDKNKLAKVGTLINCATCNKVITKVQWQQAFCSRSRKGNKKTVCKDIFHNTQTDTRRARSQAYLKD